MFTKQKGDIAETQAVNYLKKEGFKILERNYFAKKMGEIDIIALKKGIYHFIEVKSGSGFNPVYNITPNKLRKIIKSTQFYLKENHIDKAFCIDAIVIQDKELEFLENITL